jgi:hypothetical protein
MTHFMSKGRRNIITRSISGLGKYDYAYERAQAGSFLYCHHESNESYSRALMYIHYRRTPLKTGLHVDSFIFVSLKNVILDSIYIDS